METVIRTEHFTGGAVGELVTPANSIFTSTADEPAPKGCRFLPNGRGGGLCGGNVPYSPFDQGGGVFYFSESNLPAADTTGFGIHEFYLLFDWSAPGAYGSEDDFRALLFAFAPTEEEQVLVLQSFPIVGEKMVGAEYWFRVSTEHFESPFSYVGAGQNRAATDMDLRFDVTTQILQVRFANEDLSNDLPEIEIGNWYRVTAQRRADPTYSLYNASGTLMHQGGYTEWNTFGWFTRQAVQGGGPDNTWIHPLDIDDITITTERFTIETEPPVEQEIISALKNVRRRFS